MFCGGCGLELSSLVTARSGKPSEPAQVRARVGVDLEELERGPIVETTYRANVQIALGLILVVASGIVFLLAAFDGSKDAQPFITLGLIGGGVGVGLHIWGRIRRWAAKEAVKR